ncbi:MAG: hypothetical protein JSV83_08235 [Desulfobacterales bacterium]|nr:MAG: hypothetical protein JSV83_08235 [Desulfobacterales bacterium]
MRRIAYFISPHGFGHAARAASVMEAIHEIDPSIRFEIFTASPSWFFQDNLSGLFNYHYLLTDLGLVQKTPFEEDLAETLRVLNQLMPYDDTQVGAVSQQINDLNCRLAICDVAPMGLLIAKEAGIPSVLVENFTWDWIYEGYADRDTQIATHIDYLRRVFDIADVHIQTEPVCNPKTVDFCAGPASRKIKSPKAVVRRKLRLSSNNPMVLVTTGGVPQEYTFIDKLNTQTDIYFVIPCTCQTAQYRDNLILLPHHSDFFHPDLVNAADTVIGKAGYSTIAEVYHAGVPFGYIPCPNNREASTLVAFIETEMPGLPISESTFQSGDWMELLKRLLNIPRLERDVPNGADQIAEFILNNLASA